MQIACNYFYVLQMCMCVYVYMYVVGVNDLHLYTSSSRQLSHRIDNCNEISKMLMRWAIAILNSQSKGCALCVCVCLYIINRHALVTCRCICK